MHKYVKLQVNYGEFLIALKKNYKYRARTIDLHPIMTMISFFTIEMRVDLRRRSRQYPLRIAILM